jgi:ABC-type glycerol-3-phosphate transport system substrate-binding protein
LFIKYFSSPEVQARWGQGVGYLPVRISAGNYLAENPVYQAAFDLLAYGKTAPSVPGHDFIDQEVELALDAILSGLEMVETLDSLNATANQILVIHMER